MRAALLALLLAAPAAAEDYALPPAPSTGTRVDYWADKAELDGVNSTLHLTGNVTLKESTMTVTGQDIWIDDAHRTGRSDKPVLVDDGVSSVYGESGEFDFDKQTGRLFHSSGGMGNWRVRAHETRLLAERNMKYRGADFTSCDRVPPDYHFHSSAVSVVPKKHLLAWNTFFFLGPVPVFYTPVFYHSLDPDPLLKWRFQFGTDNRNGQYAKGTLITKISSTTYTRLFDDYFSNMGFGLGGQLDHHSGSDSNGALFGYRIHEDQTVNNRWGLFGSDYQKLVSSVSFQGRLQFQSDPTFNNNYVRSDLFRLTPELINSAALTKTFSKGTVRLLYARDDTQNPNNPNGFVKSTEDLPRIEAQSVSLRILNLPWLNTFSGYADDNYTLGRGYQQKSVNASWDATRSFNVARGVTYSPKFDYGETYYNEFDETNFAPPALRTNLNSTVGRWVATNNLRFITLIGHLDAAHSYSQRLKPDAFTEDTGPADKGVELNQVTFTDTFVPTYRTWGRITTGYDYRTFRDHAPTFDQRIQPITTDLSWQTSHRLIFTLHDAYVIKNSSGVGGNQSVITDVRWGDPLAGPSIGGGVSYNLATPGTYYQTVEFAYEPSSTTWRVSVALRSVVVSDGGFSRAHGLRLFEKELTWSQHWHDFFTKVLFRTRPGGVGEVTARVEFRFGNTDPKRAPRRDWESEYFPGRTREDDLR
jgi:lipopolysaccharide export system protein LptA